MPLHSYTLSFQVRRFSHRNAFAVAIQIKTFGAYFIAGINAFAHKKIVCFALSHQTSFIALAAASVHVEMLLIYTALCVFLTTSGAFTSYGILMQTEWAFFVTESVQANACNRVKTFALMSPLFLHILGTLAEASFWVENLIVHTVG